MLNSFSKFLHSCLNSDIAGRLSVFRGQFLSLVPDYVAKFPLMSFFFGGHLSTVVPFPNRITFWYRGKPIDLGLILD